MMARYPNRARPIGTDGLTATERDVLARWDGGASMQQIVAATDHSSDVVGRIVSTYAFADEDRRHLRDVVAANTRFLAAIAATGGRFA